MKDLPWVGLIVALSWAFYNLVRKKINVDTDIGLLIESLFILPIAIIIFYMITAKGYNDFSLSNPWNSSPSFEFLTIISLSILLASYACKGRFKSNIT